jgi:hypothetical protein
MELGQLLEIAASSAAMQSLPQLQTPPAQMPAQPAQILALVNTMECVSSFQQGCKQLAMLTQSYRVVVNSEGKAAIQAAAVQAQDHEAIGIRGLVRTVKVLPCNHTNISDREPHQNMLNGFSYDAGQSSTYCRTSSGAPAALRAPDSHAHRASAAAAKPA